MASSMSWLAMHEASSMSGRRELEGRVHPRLRCVLLTGYTMCRLADHSAGGWLSY
jgi:hypothetical protein